MSARFDLVTLDVREPERMRAFWTEALDLFETEREDGDRWIVLSDRAGVRRIGLQRGEPRAGTVHLDLACPAEDFESELQRLVSLGAVPMRPARHEQYGSIVNLADPEGNAFDLCAYDA
mgnify:FL=1